MIILNNNSQYLNKKREYIEKYNEECPIDCLDIRTVTDGIVLPKSDIHISKGGVLDDECRFIEESSVKNSASFICINSGYDILRDKIIRSNERVIYLGYFFRHWGHFLMDCTTRMWILFDNRFSDYKVVFPNHPAHKCDGNYMRFLELLGITEDRLVEITEPTQFREVLIPSEARYQPNKSHRDEWYDIFDWVAEKALYDKDKIPRKVYFSRSSLGKTEFGLRELEHNFKMNGYDIVFPEQLSLDEQIGIFRCADEVVSENSSICMNVVFARPGLKWVVINKYSAIHDNFTELRYKKNLNILYVDAFSNRLNFYGQKIGSVPYLISINDNIRRWFEDNGMKTESYGVIYRVKNVVDYLFCCAVRKPKVKIKGVLEKMVRRLKKYTPGIYRGLKYVLK